MIELFNSANVSQGTFTTIQDAVDAASSGWRLEIGAGTYSESVTIDKALEINGAGVGNTIIAPASGDAFSITGDIDQGGSETVSISGIQINGSTGTGVRVASTTVLSNLDLQDMLIQDNRVHGLGSLSKTLGSVTVTNVDFADNGHNGPNGNGDIVLFEFLGAATLTNVDITSSSLVGDATATKGDTAIQVSGFDSATYDVTNALAGLTLDNVTVNGAYHKAQVMIQGYTDLDALNVTNSSLTGHAEWGNLVFVDPIGSSGQDAAANAGYPGNYPGASLPQNDIDFSGFTITPDSGVNGVTMRGTGASDSITGTNAADTLNAPAEGDTDYGGDETINGLGGDDTLIGGAGNDALDGGTGTDTALYSGAREDYVIAQTATGYTITDSVGGDGTDSLTGIESLEFAGTPGITFELDANSDDISAYQSRFDADFDSGFAGLLEENSGWSGSITVMNDGDGGLNTPDGGNYAVIAQTDADGGLTGPFTRFDSYRSDFADGYSASTTIYLDMGMAVGEGFDWSVAASTQSGGHLRDFVFHVTKDGDTGTILVGASNNTNFDPILNLETGNHASISSSGWFTFEHRFYENDSGDLEVAMNVYDAAGDWVFTEIRTNPADDIDTVAGGNRYGWFTNIDVAGGIAVESISLSTAATGDISLYGAGGLKRQYDTVAEAAAAAGAGDYILDAAGEFQVVEGMSIQAAVDAAEAGDVINLESGATFSEQVLIDGKDDLTINGNGATVEMPTVIEFTHTTADGGSKNRAAIFVVRDSTDVTLDNLMLDGLGQANLMPSGGSTDYEGVLFYNASGALTDSTVTGVRDPLNGGYPSGNQRGNGVVVISDDSATRQVSVTGNTIEDYQKTGIVAAGEGLTVLVDNNVVNGSGFLPNSNAIAQNGIQISGGAFGNVTGNIISEIGYQRDDYITTHVLLFSAAAGTIVSGNTLTGTSNDSFSAGIYSYTTDGAVITNNEIDHILSGVVSYSEGNPTISGNIFSNPITGLQTVQGGSNPVVLSGLYDGNNVEFYGDLAVSPATQDGSDGTDYFTGTAFGDTFNMLGGDDFVYAGDGNDTVDGGAGADSVSGDADDDSLTGGAGDDTVDGGAGNDVVDGGADNDMVMGGDGDDTVLGGTGNDTLDGGAGADVMDGGEGDDLYLAGAGDTLAESIGGAAGGEDTVQSSESVTLGANIETLTLVDPVSETEDFEDFDLGPITDGENGWAVAGSKDQSVITDPNDPGNQVFAMSSDPTSGDFGGPISPALGATAGEPQTTADYDSQQVSFTFGAIDTVNADNSRLEVDLGTDDGSDRNNFMVIEKTADGLRIAVADPKLDGNWDTGETDNDFTSFTGNRTLIEGVDATIAHELTVAVTYIDGPDNDVVKFYLDGEFIGESTTFENYRDALGGLHADNAEDNQTSRLLFRASGSGTAQDGPGGDNEGFWFDNITTSVYNSTGPSGTGNDLANTITGNSGGNMLAGMDGDDTIDGGLGDDTIIGGAGADSIVGGGGIDTAVIEDSNASYSFNSSSVTDDGTGETDSMSGIEILEFTNARYLFVGGDSEFQTISAAVAAANAGDTVLVAAGTYAEDVVIDKSIELLATGAVTIDGQNGQLGAITLTSGVNDVRIDGFTVLGNNGNGAIENAAIYLQGAHTGITIQNNVIEARGDAGLLSEYGAAVSNVLIDGNEFTGQTFTGAEPEGFGFATQFNVGNNVPRQLVTIGGNGQNTSDITFTNNVVSGTAGGINAALQEQGNTLVTIDAANSTISDNEFTGYTNRYATALRAREANTEISGNTFDATVNGADWLAAVYAEETTGSTLDPNTFIGVDLAFNINGSAAGDTITGSANDDYITGGAGGDSIDGGAGDDTIDGGADSDVIDGGAGTDFVVGGARGSAVVSTSSTGTVQVNGDIITNIEGVLFNDTTTAGFLTKVPDATLDENEFTSIDTAALLGVDASLFDFSASNLPTGMTLDLATGVISGTPTNGQGIFTTIVAVEKATGLTYQDTFLVTVTNINDAPTSTPIAPQSVDEDTVLTLDISANFADEDIGDTLTYTATLANGDPLPAWLGFDGINAVFSGTPDNDDVAVLSIKVTAEDTGGLTTSRTFSLTVNNVNDAPTSDPIADQTTQEESPFSFDAATAGNFADVDLGDSLTYSATGLPTGLTINASTGVISGTPDDPAVGTASVTVTATDGGGLTSSQTFDLTVTNVNDAPTTSGIADQSATEDAAFSYDASAAFADVDVGDTLTYTATGLPGNLSIDTGTGIISGTPQDADTGTFVVTVTASDGSDSVSTSFSLTVDNVNDAPEVVAIADVSTAEDSAFTYSVAGNFSDADGDNLTLSATLADDNPLPSWLSFNATTGTFTGTPLNANVGTISVKVTASDGTSSTSDIFELEVTNTNDAPVAVGAAIGPKTATEDETFADLDVSGKFADPDVGDTLTYTLTGAPAGISINETTGVISGTPTESGSFTVGVQASDGNGGTLTRSFALNVTSANAAPTASAIPATTVGVKFNSEADNTTLNVFDYFEDDQDADDELTYSVTDLGGFDANDISIDGATGVITLSPDYTYTPSFTIDDDDRGSYTIEITATDTGGQSVSTDLDVSVVLSFSSSDPDGIGYISGGQVYFDSNNNSMLDAGEAVVSLDGDGDFSFTGNADFNAQTSDPAFNPFLAAVRAVPGNTGTNLATGAVVVGEFSAPFVNIVSGNFVTSNQVSPLTSLLGPLAAGGLGHDTLKANLGPLINVSAATDVVTTDYILGVANGTIGQQTFNDAVYVALTAATVRNAVQVMASAFDVLDDLGSDNFTTAELANSAYAAFSTVIAAGSFQLNNSAHWDSVIDQLESDTSITLTATQQTNLSEGLRWMGQANMTAGTTTNGGNTPFSTEPSSGDVRADLLQFLAAGQIASDTVAASATGDFSGLDYGSPTAFQSLAEGELANVLTVTGAKGTAGNDDLTGLDNIGDGSEAISGLAGDDTITGGAGSDTMDGGAGLDMLDYGDEAGGGGIAVNLVTGAATDTYGNTESAVNFENVYATTSDDVITGTTGNNTFILPGAANDSVDGGAGFDTVILPDVALADVTVHQLSTGEITFGGTILKNVERVEFNDATIQKPTDIAFAGTAFDENTTNLGAVTTTDSLDSDGSVDITYTVTDTYAGADFAVTGGNLVVDSGTLDYESTGGASPISVTITATDGDGLSRTETFAFSLNDVNEAPEGTIANQTVDEDTAFSLSLASLISDPEGGALTFSIDSAPAWLSIEAGTGNLIGTPTNDDVTTGASVTILASDGVNAVPFTFDIEVTNVNDAPVAKDISLGSLAEDTSSNWTFAGPSVGVLATDVDNVLDSSSFSFDSVTIGGQSVSLTDAGLTYNSTTGVLQIDASQDAYQSLASGSSTDVVATFTVSDGALSNTGTVTIEVQGANDGPTSSSIPGQTFAEEAAVSFDAATAGAFADVDAGDTLTYSATALPAGLSINTATGVISGTADDAAVGVHSVTVTATDGGSLTTSQTFDIEITRVDDAPVVDSPVPDMTVAENDVVSIDLSAYFVDADVNEPGSTESLSYAISGLPAGLSFDTATGEITGTPDDPDVGLHVITVTATDSTNLSVSDTFNLTVTNVNDAPETTGIADQTGQTTVPFSLDASAFFSDVDSPTLTFSATGLPDGLTINTATGVISGTPILSGVGENSVTVTASDGALSVQASFTFDIAALIVGTSAGDLLNGTGNPDEIRGLEGDDTILAGDGADEIFAATGDDVIAGQAGNDTVHGGAGIDTLDYSQDGGAGAVVVDMSNGTATDSHGDTDSFDGIENVIGTAGNDMITGDAGDNLLEDGAGDDTVLGGDGDDTFVASAGTDELVGGAGIDLLDLSNATTSVIVQLGSNPFPSIVTGAGYAFGPDVDFLGLTGIENILGGSAGDDLSGDAGDNTFFASLGADTITGGAGSDTYDASATSASQSVNLASGAVSGAFGADVLSGIENAVLGGGNDTITGSSDDNAVDGGEGVNTFIVDDDSTNATFAYLGGVLTVTSGQGTDLLTNIDAVQFNDATVSVVANADSVATSEDDTIAGSALDNDFDVADGSSALTVTGVNGGTGNAGVSVTLASGAMVTMQTDGSFVYDPNGQFEDLVEGETTTDSFTYTMEDADGNSASQTVTVNLTGVNDAPQPAPSYDLTGTLIEENGSFSLAFSDAGFVGAGIDLDEATDDLTFAIDAQGAFGTASIDTSGGVPKLVYVPSDLDALDLNDVQPITITVSVTDDENATTTFDVELQVTGTNDAPKLDDAAYTVSEDAGASVLVDLQTLVSDVDADDLPSTIDFDVTTPAGTGVTTLVGSTLSYNPMGQFEYLADGETAEVTIEVLATDTQNASDPATITVTIEGENDAVQAGAAVTVTTDEDAGTVAVALSELLSNASDVDTSDTITLSGLTRTDGGRTLTSLVVNDATGISFDANEFNDLAEGESEVLTFTYAVSDGPTSAATSVSITVEGRNDAPVISAAFLTAAQPATVNEAAGQSGSSDPQPSSAAFGLLTFSDADLTDGATVSVSALSAVSNRGIIHTGANLAALQSALAVLTTSFPGAATGNQTTQLTFGLQDMDLDFLDGGETLSVTYELAVTDDSGTPSATDTTTLVVDFVGADDPLITGDDSITAHEDDAAIDLTATLLANDSDLDAIDEFQIVSIDTTGTVGDVTLSGGSVTYKPTDAGRDGDTVTDTFTYTVRTLDGEESTATVTVEVSGETDLPVVTGISPFLLAEENTARTLGENVTLTDADGAGFGGGSAVFSLAGATADDRLFIKTDPGNILQAASGNIFYDGQIVGSYAGGESGAALNVAFGAGITDTMVNAIMSAVQFVNTSDTPPAETRTLSITATDASGDTSVTTTGLNVLDEPNAPSPAILQYGSMSVGTSFVSVTFDKSYVDPVVFATIIGATGDPVTVRVRNVDANGFEMRLQEPNHSDKVHNPEIVNWMVVEKGRWTLDDGTVIEAGTVDTGKMTNQGFESIAFGDDFGTTPTIISQTQTVNGADFVYSRQDDPTSGGFSLSLEEEEINNINGYHKPETVGWLAVESGQGDGFIAGATGDAVGHNSVDVGFGTTFDAAPTVFAVLGNRNGGNPAELNVAAVDEDSFVAFAQEDQTFDAEVVHNKERVDFLAFEGTSGSLGGTAQQTVIAEFGTTMVNSTPMTIELDHDFINPVVFVLGLENSEPGAAVARIRHLDSDSFTIWLQEPSNEDGVHGYETLTYAVMEAGSWDLGDGTKLEVGKLNSKLLTHEGFNDVTFDSAFAEGPAVFSQVQSYIGPDLVSTRQTSVSNTGFSVAMEEEEALNGGTHTFEDIGWFAIDSGAGQWNGQTFEAGTLEDALSSDTDTFLFNETFDASPLVLAQLASFNDSETAILRASGLNANGIDLRIAEDTTLDVETTHPDEDVNFFALAQAGLYTGTEWG